MGITVEWPEEVPGERSRGDRCHMQRGCAEGPVAGK